MCFSESPAPLPVTVCRVPPLVSKRSFLAAGLCTVPHREIYCLWLLSQSIILPCCLTWGIMQWWLERRHSGPCTWVLSHLALQQLSYSSPLPWQPLLRAAVAEPAVPRKQQGDSFASSQNICVASQLLVSHPNCQKYKYMGWILVEVIPVVWIKRKYTFGVILQ